MAEKVEVVTIELKASFSVDEIEAARDAARKILEIAADQESAGGAIGAPRATRAAIDAAKEIQPGHKVPGRWHDHLEEYLRLSAAVGSREEAPHKNEWETVISGRDHADWARSVARKCAAYWTRDSVLSPIVDRLDADTEREIAIAMLESANDISLSVRKLAGAVALLTTFGGAALILLLIEKA